MDYGNRNPNLQRTETSNLRLLGLCRPGWHASVSERLKPRNYYLFALPIDCQNCSEVDRYHGYSTQILLGLVLLLSFECLHRVVVCPDRAEAELPPQPTCVSEQVTPGVGQARDGNAAERDTLVRMRVVPGHITSEELRAGMGRHSRASINFAGKDRGVGMSFD